MPCSPFRIFFTYCHLNIEPIVSALPKSAAAAVSAEEARHSRNTGAPVLTFLFKPHGLIYGGTKQGLVRGPWNNQVVNKQIRRAVYAKRL